jgi:alpha-tubulin suppressor-like RCC1 family protein
VCLNLTPDGYTEFLLPSTQVVPVDEWTHVVATYDGVIMSLYINDVLDTTRVVDMGDIHVGNASLQIGSVESEPWDFQFNGVIDEAYVSGEIDIMSGMSLYINGVLDTTCVVDMGHIHVGNASLQIGSVESEPWDFRFDGVVDEAHLYGELAGSPTALRASWPLDDGGGSNVLFNAVAAAGHHSLGIKSDGTVVGWGANDYGQCDIPTPNQDFVAIASGGFMAMAHDLGLKTDGRLVAWGDNRYGQCFGPSPTPNEGFVAVASSPGSEGSPGALGHNLGLRSDSTIVAWGMNTRGQCDVPSPNENFVAIAAGGLGGDLAHSLALKSEGTIIAWGFNPIGQCNVPAPNEDFVRIAAGAMHSVGLKSSGAVVAWGYNEFGQCDVPGPNEDFVEIAAGGSHSLGVKYDGTLVAWGANGSGQCDVPAPNEGFVRVAAAGECDGLGHSLGLKLDGTIVAWGDNSYAQCEVPAPNEDFVAVAAGRWHSLGLKSNGTIVAWGRNDFGQCSTPQPNENFVAITAGGLVSLGVKGLTPTAIGGPRGPEPSGAPALEIVAVAPNPFNPSTTLWFRIAESSVVGLEVYDAGGRRVRTMDLGYCGRGRHRTDWDGRDLRGNWVASGVYFVRLRSAAGVSAAVKVVVVR